MFLAKSFYLNLRGIEYEMCKIFYQFPNSLNWIKNQQMRKIIFVLMANLFLSFLSAQESPQIDWQFGRLGLDLAETGIIVEDINDDGLDEIISTGAYNSSGFGNSEMFFTVLKYSESEDNYVFDWMSNIIYHTIHTIQLFDLNQDGYFELYLGLDNGMIYVYDTKTFDKINEFDTSKRGEVPIFEPPNNVTCICFEDINNDSHLNVAATNGDTTYVYNDNYELIQKIPLAARYFEVGNIDADPYNEIVYSNGNILQLINGNITNENGFQTFNENVRVELCDMNADNVKDVVYSSHDTLFVYDFKINQYIWIQEWISDFGYDQNITGLWAHDYNGDNIKDIFIGNSSRDGVYCYNGENGNKEFSLKDSQQGNGIINVAVSDLDNDTNQEIIWSSGANNTSADYFFIYDLSTLEKDWQSKYFNSDFKAFDIGDVDNDGELEIVSGVFGEFLQYYDHGFLTVFNAENKNIEWQNETEIFGVHVDDFTEIEIGDINNDGKNELLLGVEYGYSYTYIYVFDSAFEVERNFQISGMSMIIDMKIFDIDNDEENELIVTSGTNVSGSTNPDEWQNYIYIFDGASGEIEWQSEQLAGIGSKTGLLNIGNIDDDDACEIVAMLNDKGEDFHTLIIIDGLTHEISLDNSMDYTSVSLLDIENDGRDEILAAVYPGMINVLDGRSLSLKQTFNLPCKEINTINPFDLNDDNIQELIVTDKRTLMLYDLAQAELKWTSDTINSNIGTFNSLKIGNIDADEQIEIMINVNHGIFNFKVNYDSISGIIPPGDHPHQNSSIIYPNPTKNKITIETKVDTPNPLMIRIFDAWGCKVQEEFHPFLSNRNQKMEVDVSKLKPGFHIIQLICNNQIILNNTFVKIQ